MIRRVSLASIALTLFSACTVERLPPPIQPAKGPRDRVVAEPAKAFPAQIRLERPGMTCRSATKAARAALKRMGYVVESIVAPTPDQVGEIRALRNTGWYTGDPGDSFGVAVRLYCNDQGSILEAASEEKLSERMVFKRDFEGEINRAVSRRSIRPRPVANRPQAELQIIVHPLSGSAATQQIGRAASSGVTPVLVRIINKSARTYRFKAERVSLTTEERKRVRPLSAGEVADRVTEEWASTANDQQIRDGDIAPGTVLEGYVYVPRAAYRRAKVVLIEAESEEAEGFSVEF